MKSTNGEWACLWTFLLYLWFVFILLFLLPLLTHQSILVLLCCCLFQAVFLMIITRSTILNGSFLHSWIQPLSRSVFSDILIIKDIWKSLERMYNLLVKVLSRLTQVSFSAILLIREDTRLKRAEPFVLVTFYVFPCFSIRWKCNFAIWDIPITKHEIGHLYTSLY